MMIDASDFIILAQNGNYRTLSQIIKVGFSWCTSTHTFSFPLLSLRRILFLFVYWWLFLQCVWYNYIFIRLEDALSRQIKSVSLVRLRFVWSTITYFVLYGRPRDSALVVGNRINRVLSRTYNLPRQNDLRLCTLYLIDLMSPKQNKTTFLSR